MKTQVYEIKKGNYWEMVRATSMKAINDFCKDNNDVTDWRLCGMMSRRDLQLSKNLIIVK